MKKALLACTAIWMAASLAPALAQTAPAGAQSTPTPPVAGKPTGPGPQLQMQPGQPGQPVTMRMMPPAPLNIEALNAFDDARLAAVKNDLKLSPDQLKKWPPIEAAIKAFYKNRIDLIQKHHDVVSPPDPMTMISERIDVMTTTAALMKKFVTAADPLYKTLDPAGKHRLMELTINTPPSSPIHAQPRPPGVGAPPPPPVPQPLTPGATPPPAPKAN